MVQLSPVARAVKQAIAMGAMAAASVPVLAQDQDQNQGTDASLTEVVITGSRIAQPNLTTTSPITQVTSEDVQLQGVTRIEDLMTQLPQAFATQNSTVSNGATGTATISLRNLGSRRTLVLVDGRRLPYGDANNSAADLNEIPSSMVERVEVLTGGASAVYGSDAIAGVVNFIMKKDFEGVELSAQYGFYNHNNDYGGPGAVKLRDVIAARAATNPSQFALPDDNVNVGYSREFSMLVGVGTEDGRGNMTAYATYRKNDEILQRDYDYSACSLAALGATTASFGCGGSSTSFPGRFTDFATYDFTLDPAGAGNTFRNWSGARDQYNFGPLNFYQRPDTRYTAGVMGHFELNERADVYAQIMYADNRTLAQIAPSGNFFSTSQINCNNPFLSASQRTGIGCTAANITNGDLVTMYVGRRNVEGGGRQYDFHSTSLRLVTGLKGQIVEGWSYDVSNQFSRKTMDLNQTNDFSSRRLRNAMIVDLVGGVPTCRAAVSGIDPSCVPVNFFQIGGVTQAALNYLQVPTLAQTVIDQNIVNALVTGDLEQYGWKFPTANSGVQIAIGAEYRRDKLGFVPDESIASGDPAGAGGPQPPVSGAVDVTEIFMESRIPLVQDRKGAQQLGLDIAYRFSDYDAVTTNTWKIGADWAPVEDVRFRASFQRAIRAANILELFTAQGFNLFDMNGDPCGAGARNPNATAAECIATGVPAAQVGSAALDSPAGQYNFLQGGNPALVPEESDTFSFGVVFTPSFAPNLTASIDYFDIQIDKTISTFGAENTLNACYNNGDAAACGRINRNALGQLWIGTGHVEDLNINIGSLQTKGVDLQVNYNNLQIGNLGKLNFSLTATHTDELITDPGPGLSPYECVGFYSSSCSSGSPPSPEWRHRFRIGWNMPWKDISLSLTWRHLGEVKLFAAPGTNPVTTRLDYKLPSFDYFDLTGSWAINDKADLRIGINNITDKNPPLSASVGTTGNGNTYPQIYEALGRYIFGNLTWKF